MNQQMIMGMLENYLGKDKFQAMMQKWQTMTPQQQQAEMARIQSMPPQEQMAFIQKAGIDPNILGGGVPTPTNNGGNRFNY